MRRKQVQYFAYASNLNTKQMAERKVPFTSSRVAYLPGYEVVFNKRGVLYPGHTAANLEQKEGSHVEGMLYVLPDETALMQLDTFEIGYDKVTLPVFLRSDNSSQEAIVYIAKPEFILTGILPAPEYLRRILEGGKDVFSPEYKESLHQRVANLV